MVIVDTSAKNIGVRHRIGAWLLLVAAIVAVSAVILSAITRNQLERTAQESLQQLVQLEQGRLVAELSEVRNDVRSIAASPDLLADLAATPLDLAALHDDLGLLLSDTQQLSLIHI